MIETGPIEKWLYTLLTGDATLAAQNGGRVYGYLAPENKGYPYTLYHPQALGGSGALGGRGVAKDLYTVKMVGNTDDLEALQAGADRIFTLLDGTIVAHGGMQLRVKWVKSVSYIETKNDSRFSHLGAVFRIAAS